MTDDAVYRHLTTFHQLTLGELEIVYGVVYDLYIREILPRLDAPRGAGLTTRDRQIQQLLGELTPIVTDVYSSAWPGVAEAGARLATFDTVGLSDILRDIVGVSMPYQPLTADQLLTLANTARLEGIPARAWWAKQAPALLDRLRQAVAASYARGETLQDLVYRIRGREVTPRSRTAYRTAAGELRYHTTFAKGIMQVSTRDASSIARTAYLQVAADARRKMYDRHPAVRGIQQISTLDKDTTLVCRSYDLKRFVYSNHELVPDGHSLPYEGGVPRHWGCRSSEVPLLTLPEQLARRLGIDPDSFGPQYRASAGGPVAGNVDYAAWFEQQSPEYQQTVLTRRSYQLWSQGTITTAQALKIIQSVPPR